MAPLRIRLRHALIGIALVALLFWLMFVVPRFDITLENQSSWPFEVLELSYGDMVIARPRMMRGESKSVVIDHPHNDLDVQTSPAGTWRISSFDYWTLRVRARIPGESEQRRWLGAFFRIDGSARKIRIAIRDKAMELWDDVSDEPTTVETWMYIEDDNTARTVE